jgi:hypothetical protein
MAVDDVRRRAERELRRAARAALGDLGLRQAGSSPRQWMGDHGWWVVNVEFQASRSANTAMLNVGVQHLWTRFSGRAFAFGGRVDGVVADLDGVTDDAVRDEAERIARAAAVEVIGWHERLGDDEQHLRWLAASADRRPVPPVEAAFALVVLGDLVAARRTLLMIADALDPGIAWQRDQADDCRAMAQLTADAAEFRAELDRRIHEMRATLKLRARPGRVFA